MDTFICKMCERVEDGEVGDIEQSLYILYMMLYKFCILLDESKDLDNGVHLENVRKFCYLGDMLNGVDSKFSLCGQGKLCKEKV